jgi:hypothetical protein
MNRSYNAPVDHRMLLYGIVLRLKGGIGIRISSKHHALCSLTFVVASSWWD